MRVRLALLQLYRQLTWERLEGDGTTWYGGICATYVNRKHI